MIIHLFDVLSFIRCGTKIQIITDYSKRLYSLVRDLEIMD